MTAGDTQSTASIPYAAEVVAKPSRSYRLKWCIMGLVLVAYGGWSIYDGFVRYPRENEEARREGRDKVPHPGLDVPFNQVIGLALPPFGLAVIIWALHNSRGQYRLVGSTLHVPGHPPVNMEDIRAIDKTRWDRKGIAVIEYDRPGGAGTGRLSLDDYVYEREPTDAILERIEARVLPAGESSEGAAAADEAAVEEQVRE